MTGPTDPVDPRYPPEPYAAGYQAPYHGAYYPGGYQPGTADFPPATSDRRTQLGPRALTRPGPRLGVTLGGLGGLLVIAGIAIWAVGYLAQGIAHSISVDAGGSGAPDDSRRFLGALLSLAAVLAGYAVIVRFRQGPLVTGAVAVTGLGVPLMMGLFTLDIPSSSPLNIDAVTWVTVVVAAASYAFVPGARGRLFYLGLTAYLVWEYAVDKVAPTALSSATALGTRLGTPLLSSSSHPNWAGLAAVSLIFGLGYFLLAWVLDNRGRHAIATPLVVVGIPATGVGIAALAPDLEQVGVGVAMFVIGFALAWYGVRAVRRFTAWFWTAVAVAGAVVVLAKAVSGSSVITIGVLVLALGAAFIAFGVVVATALRETPEFEEEVVVRPGRTH